MHTYIRTYRKVLVNAGDVVGEVIHKGDFEVCQRSQAPISDAKIIIGQFASGKVRNDFLDTSPGGNGFLAMI